MFRRECESIRPLISAFFDGDLTPSESMSLHQHLAECEDCRRTIDEYQRIRSDFRDLPPVPTPPDQLANRVWAETIDRPKPTGFRRIVGATTAKAGLSAVAALAIVAVIGAFLLVRGYNQNVTPEIVNSDPVSAQSWPVYQPVEIQFNKPMNHQSVEDNLQIWPPGERTRIPTSWDGNTLVLGASSAQSTLFLPDTTYQVMVLGSAKDAYGHQLGKTWSLSFRTSPISTTVRQATPTTTATGAANSTPAPTQQPVVAVDSPTPTPIPDNSGQTTSTVPSSVAPISTAQSTPATRASTPTPISSASPPTPTPQPTAAVTATATPTPAPATPQPPTPSPEATPTTASASPSPVVTATPTPIETPDSATPTPVVIPVTGAFGSVYWANQDVQDKLGAPLNDEAVMNASELGFQRGTMYERYDQSEIYIFFANNQWRKEPDTWTPADGQGGGTGPEAGLWIPKESFWKIWNSDSDLASSIGYAVEQDAHLMDKLGGSFQNFENGIMLYSDQGFVYVVYNDGTWSLYPDTSGHGDLLTPTPDTGGAATPVDPTAVPTDTPASDTSTATSEPASITAGP